MLINVLGWGGGRPQNIQGMTGTPMVAASPERHDGGLQANPVEVQSYQPPWKVLSDFALQSDIDQPAFQQLVSGGSPRERRPSLRQQGGPAGTSRPRETRGWGGVGVEAGASQGQGWAETGVAGEEEEQAPKKNKPPGAFSGRARHPTVQVALSVSPALMDWPQGPG